jgi:hypothetical protein
MKDDEEMQRALALSRSTFPDSAVPLAPTAARTSVITARLYAQQTGPNPLNVNDSWLPTNGLAVLVKEITLANFNRIGTFNGDVRDAILVVVYREQDSDIFDMALVACRSMVLRPTQQSSR